MMRADKSPWIVPLTCRKGILPTPPGYDVNFNEVSFTFAVLLHEGGGEEVHKLLC